MNLEYVALLVSVLSGFIAVVAILRANEANRIAAESNRITRHYNLRPARLEACNLVRDFAHYCSTYRTMFLQGMVSGTSELMDRRRDFTSRLQTLGPLGMDELEGKATEFSNKAVQLQRALDRSRSREPKPLDSKYPSLDENIDAIVDWFAEEEGNLSSVFDAYLKDGK